MCRRGHVTWLILSLAARLCAAAPPSVIDPPVTLDFTDTALHDVLAKITEQTGASFQSPFGRMGQPPGGDDAARAGMDRMREMFDPKVTIKAENESLRSVVHRLSEAAHIQFVWQAMPAGYRLQPRGPQGEDDRPHVAAGNYTIHVENLRTERVRERRFRQPGPPSDIHDILSVALSIDAPTNLAWAALSGIDGAVQASLDGEKLDPFARGGAPPALIEPMPTGMGPSLFQMVFQLPKEDAAALTDLAGELVVYQDAAEHVFSFTDLQTPNQLLSQDQIDVKLKQIQAVEGGGMGGGGGRGPGFGPQPGWNVDVEISQPLNPELKRRVEMLQQGFRGMPGMPGGRGGPGGPPGGPPPNAPQRLDNPEPQRGGGVMLAAFGGNAFLVQGPQPGAPGGPGGPGGRGGRGGRGGGFGGPGGPGGFGMQMMFGMGRDLSEMVPGMAVELPDGRRVLATPAGMPQNIQTGDDRATYTLTYFVPQFEGNVNQLLVGVVDLGERTQRVPFKLGPVDLPAAQGQPQP